MAFDERTTMSAGGPATNADGHLAIREWDKQYHVNVPAFAATRRVAESRPIDDEGHGSVGLLTQPFIEQVRIGVMFRPIRNPHEPSVTGESGGARKAQIGAAFENEIP